MTLTELKALLETLPDTSRVSVRVQEYYFPLAAVQVQNDELLLIASDGPAPLSAPCVDLTDLAVPDGYKIQH